MVGGGFDAADVVEVEEDAADFSKWWMVCRNIFFH